MDLIALPEHLVRISLPAVNNQQGRVVVELDIEASQEVGQRASRRERHLQTTQCSLRRLPLKRRVEVNGDYQLKMLSRSDSDAS